MVRLSEPEISADIIDACRHGDRSAFRAIYDTHKDRVYSIALYFFRGDAATANDVTQQVFVKVITEFHLFRGEANLSTWLHRLVVNTCIDTARARRSWLVPMEHAVAGAAAPDPTQFDEIASSQLAHSIQRAVSSLPPKFRIAILLRYFEELSYEEMAEVLNCSIGTVASRLSRGHRLLASKLAPMKDWFEKRNT